MAFVNLLSDERMVIGALLNEAERLGYSCSIHDGEEWALSACTNYLQVRAALGAVDCETLLFRDPAAPFDQSGNVAQVGRVFLVYGNGSDVMADWSDNAAMSALLQPALALADELSAAA